MQAEGSEGTLTCPDVSGEDTEGSPIRLGCHGDGSLYVLRPGSHGEFVLHTGFHGFEIELNIGIRARGADILDGKAIGDGDADYLCGEGFARLPEEQSWEELDRVADKRAKDDSGLGIFWIIRLDDDRLLIEAVAIEGLEGDVDFACLPRGDGPCIGYSRGTATGGVGAGNLDRVGTGVSEGELRGRMSLGGSSSGKEGRGGPFEVGVGEGGDQQEEPKGETSGHAED